MKKLFAVLLTTVLISCGTQQHYLRCPQAVVTHKVVYLNRDGSARDSFTQTKTIYKASFTKF